MVDGFLDCLSLTMSCITGRGRRRLLHVWVTSTPLQGTSEGPITADNTALKLVTSHSEAGFSLTAVQEKSWARGFFSTIVANHSLPLWHSPSHGYLLNFWKALLNVMWCVSTSNRIFDTSSVKMHTNWRNWTLDRRERWNSCVCPQTRETAKQTTPSPLIRNHWVHTHT